MDDEHLNIDIKDTDLNDPDLMSELEQLSGPPKSNDSAEKCNPTKSPDRQHVKKSLPQKTANKVESFDMISEDDIMNDPDLLEELQFLNAPQHSNASTLTNQTKTSNSQNLNYDDDAIDTAISQCFDPQVAKQMALKFRREDNTSGAMKWFKRFRELDASSKLDASSNPSKSLRPLKDSKVSKLENSNSPSSVQNPISMKTQQQSSFIELEKALIEAEQSNLTDAKRLKDIKPKEAADKFRKYKYYNQELSVLRSRQGILGYSAPLFRWENVKKEEKVENVSIGDDQIQVSIEGLFGLDSAYNGREVYISFDAGFYTNIKEALISTTLPAVIVENNNAVFKFQSNFNVIKRTKSLQTLFCRKKVRFEIFLISKKTFFFTPAPTCIGVGSMTFAELSKKCRCGGDIFLAEDDKKSSKKIPGVIRVSLGLRNPISGPEMKVSLERNLNVDSWPPVNNAVSNSIPQTTDPKSSLPTKSVDNNTLSSSGIPISSSTSTAPRTAPTVESVPANLMEVGVILTEKEKYEPLSVDLLESNDVLEYELEFAQNQMKSFASSLSDTDALILKIRITTLTNKAFILQTKVGEGKLDLSEYLDMIRKRLMRDEALMKYLLSNSSRAMEASAVKKRVEIMTVEIKGAEENTEE